MRIGLDMLATQSAGRTRGTGRYTTALVSELIRQTDHEWFLYFHGDLPRCEPWGSLPGSVTERMLPAQTSLHLNAQHLLRDNVDHLDVLLFTCPLENFQGYLPPFPTRRGPKLAAIVYDFIPLRFPQHYLSHPGIAEAYRRSLAALGQYDLLLTISESCCHDAIELLQMPADRVETIGGGSDARFFYPPESRQPSEVGARWLAARGIARPYVYALTALDFRKNIAGLLSAIERLPAQLISQYDFVITCAPGNDEDAQRARGLVERSPAASRLVLTPRLDDAELRTLYQYAAAFVFPSRYEGFGLPLVEAMQCGAPVIAGNNSSQIEVVGDAGLLVDVDDAEAMASQIARLLADQSLAEQLRSKGIERARKFSWQTVANRCVTALEEAGTQRRRSHWLGTLAARGRLAIEARWDRYAPRQRRVPA